MGIFRQFPYSNFHEMNMDEIIKIVKNMLEEWAQYYAEWDTWMAEINDDWSNYQEVMNTAWQNMQNFINDYFDNLDVQEEINNKIISMVNTGEFATIVEPYIPPRVTAWLTEHITEPVGVVIDTSLSVAGACADAKATGDAFADIKKYVDYSTDKYYHYKNMLVNPNLTAVQGATSDVEIILNDDCNIVRLTNSGSTSRCNFPLKQPINNKVYMSFKARSVNAANYIQVKILEGDGTTVAQLGQVLISDAWNDYSFEHDLSLSNVSLIRLANGYANTSIEITNLIVSNEPINYNYSVKTKISDIETAMNVLNGGVTPDNFAPKLKELFKYKFQTLPITFTDGYYMNASGVLTENRTSHYVAIPVEAGDVIQLTGSHGSLQKLYVLISNNAVIDYYPIETVSTLWETKTIIIPSNGTLYFNTYSVIGASAKIFVDYAIDSYLSLSGKTWYALGDSITAYAEGYHAIIAEETGVEVTNGGVSGSGYMKPINDHTFVDRANLSSVYNIVTVFGSVNDMRYVAEHLGTESDTGTETLGGCFNTVIDNLYASGNYHIGIIAPIPQGSTNGNPANTTGTFAKYTELLEKVCKRRGVPYLDLWHCSNIQPWDADFTNEYMQDNTHPNTNGHKIFAPRIKAFIETL